MEIIQMSQPKSLTKYSVNYATSEVIFYLGGTVKECAAAFEQMLADLGHIDTIRLTLEADPQGRPSSEEGGPSLDAPYELELNCARWEDQGEPQVDVSLCVHSTGASVLMSVWYAGQLDAVFHPHCLAEADTFKLTPMQACKINATVEENQADITFEAQNLQGTFQLTTRQASSVVVDVVSNHIDIHAEGASYIQLYAKSGNGLRELDAGLYVKDSSCIMGEIGGRYRIDATAEDVAELTLHYGDSPESGVMALPAHTYSSFHLSGGALLQVTPEASFNYVLCAEDTAVAYIQNPKEDASVGRIQLSGQAHCRVADFKDASEYKAQLIGEASFVHTLVKDHQRLSIAGAAESRVVTSDSIAKLRQAQSNGTADLLDHIVMGLTATSTHRHIKNTRR